MLKLFLSQERSPSTEQLYLFFQQFSTMLSSGIPVITCLDLLLWSNSNGALHTFMRNLRDDLLAGKRIFTSVQASNYFDSILCQLIYIGEQTGKLDTMLQECANYLHEKMIWSRKIKKALVYPSALFSIAFFILLFILIFIVPRFALLFQANHVPLPLLTHILFFLADSLKHYSGWLIILLFVISISYYKANRKKEISNILFQYMLIFPFIKKWYHLILFNRLSRHLAILLQSGISLSVALQVVSENSISPFLYLAISSLQKQIQAGSSFAHALEEVALFPPLMIQFVKMGEQSGTLDLMLFRLATLWESELDSILSTLLPLLEPLIMLLLGVLIGGIVLALYLPIFKLGSMV